jgi:hypothetical protein
MPDRKEPHFWGRDLEGSWPYFIRDRAQYLSLFAAARGKKRVGEASVFYLYSRRAAREIRAFDPAARLIVMLRNPVDMMHSLHAQFVAFGNEDIRDFAAALDAEADRKRGRRRPRFPGYPGQVLFYRDVARYTEQVARYFDAFGREQVHVILHQDLKRDPARVVRDVCRFLGLDARLAPRFRVLNSNRRRPLAARLRRRLQEEFADETRSLERLLGRGLASWRGAP